MTPLSQQQMDAARAFVNATVAAALLIRQCAQALDPAVAFGIAVYGFVEGTKTVPAPIESP